MRSPAALLLAAVTLAAAGPAAAQATLDKRAKGSPTAPVTVYEMSDFQCPFCRRFALETYPALEERYVKTGKVRWVFVHFPLTQIHRNAAPAAALTICAARQDRFWPVHDRLFRDQELWGPLREPAAFFQALADSSGVDRGRLTACMRDSTVMAEVEADARGARQAGAASTPTFYIEGGLLVGAQPLATFTRILDSIVAAKARR